MIFVFFFEATWLACLCLAAKNLLSILSRGRLWLRLLQKSRGEIGLTRRRWGAMFGLKTVVASVIFLMASLRSPFLLGFGVQSPGSMLRCGVWCALAATDRVQIGGSTNSLTGATSKQVTHFWQRTTIAAALTAEKVLHEFVCMHVCVYRLLWVGWCCLVAMRPNRCIVRKSKAEKDQMWKDVNFLASHEGKRLRRKRKIRAYLCPIV